MRTIAKTWRACAGVAIAGAVLAGCADPASGNGEDAGAGVTAEATQQSAPAPVRPPAVFDPCEEIPDEAVEAVGLDPATKYTSIFGNESITGVHWTDHRECAWEGPHMWVWIASDDRSLEDVRGRTIVENVRQISINGRDALHYNLLSCGPRACAEVAFQTGTGNTWAHLRLSSLGDLTLRADDLVLEYAALLEPYLPAE